MNKFVSFLVGFTVITGLVPGSALATDAYANALTTSSITGLYNPTQALGAPDGLYADFLEDDLMMVLDMGEGEEGAGDLELTYGLLDVGALVHVSFLAVNNDVLGTASTYLDANASMWIAAYAGTEPYRYVRIDSLEDKGWKLDAVEMVATAVVDEPTEEPAEEGPVDEPTDEAPVAEPGDLIRTTESPSVYLVGEDGKRHAFPNATVFGSWGYSFDDVEYVSMTDMASFTLGGNVTVKPASYLVKIHSDPKVYAVAPEAELRWIVDEKTAIDIYGADWASLVVDIDVVFWGNYTIGANIDEVSDTTGWEESEHRY